MPSVAIAILNYNGLHLLQKYLPIVATHHPHHDIYIIDNHSSDNSAAWIHQHFPDIHLIQHTQNFGFAKGYNEGLKHIHTDYYVLLNNDVRTTENWLSPILTFMEQNPDVAVCMPKLADDKNTDYFEYAGACGGFIDTLGYPFCRGRIFLSVEKDIHQYDDTREIFWASGACMIIKSKIFWEAGGFDNDFFAHMEEIDLCWRIKNLGYRIFVIPQSKVYHLGGGTLNKINPHKTYLNFRNSLLTLLKNHPPQKIFMKIFLRLVLDGIAGLKFLLEGHGKHTLSVIRAHWYVYKNGKKFWKKRQQFEAQHQVQYTLSPILHKSMVWQHYVSGRKYFKDLSHWIS